MSGNSDASKPGKNKKSAGKSGHRKIGIGETTQDTFTSALLAWFEHSGRYDLPWQHKPTAYRVWVSEIMLQQTQVSTVVPYYQRWMERFPDVSTLAEASLDSVLHLWSGLGYYARARNLHRAAQIICDEYDERFPGAYEAVLTLPGIGRSTAGAILALSANKRYAILDGNVRRVLTRYHALAGWPGKREIENQLWALAEQHTPDTNVAAYTQAIMDLGATVCTRLRPACGHCPVADGCEAHARGAEAAFPTPRPKKARPLKVTWMALLIDAQQRVCLQRRPPTGIWGGLWSFPEYSSLADLQRATDELGGDKQMQIETWPVVDHAFTHYQLQITPVLVRLGGGVKAVKHEHDRCWIAPDAPPGLGLAAPVSGLLRRLREDLQRD